MEVYFPKCLKCNVGVLVPLSDYGSGGANITYKAWVCTNSECGFHIRIDNGEIGVGNVDDIQQSPRKHRRFSQ